MSDKVWCCRTEGDGRREHYMYGIPVAKCSNCMGCKSVKDYPEDPRQNIQILRGYK